MGEQVFKKTDNGGANEAESDFVVGEGNIEVPEIDGVMAQINKTLHKSESVRIEPIEIAPVRRVRSGCCWSNE
jgi:hypothetical protein